MRSALLLLLIACGPADRGSVGWACEHPACCHTRVDGACVDYGCCGVQEVRR